MHDVPERHRSLRAAVDQSWRLLSYDERRVLSRLSVFRGAFAREGADRRAAEVLLFSMGHEAMAYRHVAQSTLDELLDRLVPEELVAAREAAAALDLDELVADTLREKMR